MKTIMRFFFVAPWAYHLVRWIVGGIFIYAGAVKLMDPRAFARAIYEYGLAPDMFLVPTAVGLPALEVLAGIGLIFDMRGSIQVIFGFLALFLGVLGYGMIHNLDIDCGCFSREEIRTRNSLRIAFFRDLWLLGAVLYLFFWQRIRSRFMDGRESPT